jgi:hypothetical protein
MLLKVVKPESFQCLCKAVEDILTRFGTDFTITFQAA